MASVPHRAFTLLVVLIRRCLLAGAQYDFPVDSCACHIHYEVWVQLQFQMSNLLTASFPDLLFQEGSPVHSYISRQDCSNPRGIKNVLEWTLGPANSDCAPGHMSQHVLCAQASILQGDVEAARRYFEFANYMFPLAMPCMDPEIWTITPATFYNRYRAVVMASEVLRNKADVTMGIADLRSLAWKPVDDSGTL